MMRLVNGSSVLVRCFKGGVALAILLMTLGAYGNSYLEPEVVRNDGVEAKIDTENFEIGTYAGALSLVDFGVNGTYGLRADYHLTEDFFLEFAYGVSKASETSFETLNALTLLSDSDRDLSLMVASLGWHFMPGETFVTDGLTLTSQLYGMIGMGKVDFAGQSETLFNLGLGYRALVSDWFALRFDFKDHIFGVDVLGDDKQTHNFEVSTGVSFFF